jgi:SAM-dependent methyltransferase
MDDLEGEACQHLSGCIDVITPYAVRVAATLRLADLIAAGASRLDALADAARVDSAALRRLMRYLACRGVFREVEPDAYALTDPARLLLDGHSLGLRAWLDVEGVAGRMDLAVTGLLGSIRTGDAAYPSVLGRPFWDDLAAEPARAQQFDRLMDGHSEWFAQAVVDSYDWSSAAHVVDVGGGTGTLLARILRADARLRGTLVELPATVATAEARFASAGVADRCRVVAGSFFEPLPRGGDLYVLANIVHDWSDREAVAILRRAAEAAGTAGRVLVVERALDEGDAEEMTGMDLRMLVVFGSRERTLGELRELAAGARLAVEAVHRTRVGYLLIECVSGDPSAPEAP